MMTTTFTWTTTSQTGAARLLTAADAERYAAHLAELEPEARRRRFQRESTEAAARAHGLAAMANADVDVIAWPDAGAVRAATEIAFFPGCRGLCAEAAFSVHAPFRGQGLGRRLLAAAEAHALAKGADTLLVMTERSNGAMLGVLAKSAAAISYDGVDATAILALDAPKLGARPRAA